jgi:hypothetical protein
MRVLADSILVVHVAFVLFVVAGLPAIWLGAALHWRWVRSFAFRIAHLGAITFVALEAVAGIMCPLTVWEDALRGASTETSLMARWLRSFLYYSLPEWVFTCAYLVFALLVLLTWWRVPPRRSATK